MSRRGPLAPAAASAAEDRATRHRATIPLRPGPVRRRRPGAGAPRPRFLGAGARGVCPMAARRPGPRQGPCGPRAHLAATGPPPHPVSAKRRHTRPRSSQPTAGPSCAVPAAHRSPASLHTHRPLAETRSEYRERYGFRSRTDTPGVMEDGGAAHDSGDAGPRLRWPRAGARSSRSAITSNRSAEGAPAGRKRSPTRRPLTDSTPRRPIGDEDGVAAGASSGVRGGADHLHLQPGGGQSTDVGAIVAGGPDRRTPART